MKPIKIISDSTLTAPKELLNKSDIYIMKMPFKIDGVECEHDISQKEFIDRISASKKSSTSQVKPLEIEKTFNKFLDEGFDIIYAAFSKGCSGTYQTALSIKNQIIKERKDAKIVVLDTKAGEGGLGLYVFKLLELIANKQTNIDTVEEDMKKYSQSLEQNFVVGDIKFLAKNGRLSHSKAIISTVLDVKPVLHLSKDMGTIEVMHKSLGFKKAVAYMLNKLETEIDKKETKFILISHMNKYDLAKELKEKIELSITNIPVYIESINYIIGSHTGTNTIALFYYSK